VFEAMVGNIYQSIVASKICYSNWVSNAMEIDLLEKSKQNFVQTKFCSNKILFKQNFVQTKFCSNKIIFAQSLRGWSKIILLCMTRAKIAQRNYLNI